MATFNFMLSGSDEEILNAFIIADNISIESNSMTSNHTYEKASDLPDAYESSKTPSIHVSDSSDDSGCPKLQEFNKTAVEEKHLFHIDPEYQTLLQNVSALQVMCDLCIEKNRKAEAENCDLVQNLMKNSKQVLSIAMLKENLIKIETTNSHIVALSKQYKHIKQLLGNGSFKNTLKVNPSCQRNVIKFFQLANELMESLEKDKKCIERCLDNGVDHWNPTSRQHQLQISEILEEMERRIGELTDFRSNLGVICIGGMEKSNGTISEIESSCIA